MGNKKTYYYFKPKTAPRVTWHRPIDIRVSSDKKKTASVSAPGIILGKQSQVMDMQFEVAAIRPAISLSIWFWLKIILIGVIAFVLYMAGGLIFSFADSMKADISELATRGISKLELAATAAIEQDINGAKANFIAADNLFSRAQLEILSLGQTNLYLSGLAAENSQIVTGQKLIDSGQSLAQAGSLLIDTLKPLMQYFNGAVSSQLQVKDFATQVTNLLYQNIGNLDRALAKVNKASSLLNSINPDVIDPVYAAAVVNAQEKTAALQNLVMTLGTIARELPDILGFNNPRYYAILNQNNNELRATGGFVGSVAFVKIYKGQIEEMSVDTTQRIDGQIINPSLDMPTPLRAIATDWETGDARWGTRDSNWYFDFPTSAKTFQKLYEDSGIAGGSLDGIIAITPEVMRDQLRIFGSIYFEEEDITLTASNVVEVIQADIAANRYKRENPKELINKLAPILMERLLTASHAQFQDIQASIMQRLVQKDILIYTRNPRFQKVIEDLNFAGAMPLLDQNEDFLAVVRSNLGGMKSSQRVVEEIKHTIMINLTGAATESLSITYTHTGTGFNYLSNGEAPDGVNRDYVRVYVPLGSTLITSSGQDEGTQVEIYEEGDKTVFAFWVTTPPKTENTINLSYQLPYKVNGNYRLLVEKQPGADTTLLTSTLKLSPALKLAGGDDSDKIKRLFNGRLVTDLDLSANYIQVN